MEQTIFLYYPHKKQYKYELSENLSFCTNCYSAILTDKSGNQISTVKPRKYDTPQETTLPLFLTVANTHAPYNFVNKKDYLKVRKDMVKNMKSFCNQININMKTFFLALHYFDRICSRMVAFDTKALNRIYKICIILAAKFLEMHTKGTEIKRLAGSISTNYAKDELYILSLINYDLATFTSYDILNDLFHCGFLFNNEKFQIRKMHSIYDEIENILYLFSESKNYIEMTHKEIAIAIIGLIRETLGLTAFSKNIQSLCINDYLDIHYYLVALNRFKKCFKFIEIHNSQNCNNINSDSSNTEDTNSDHNNNESKSLKYKVNSIKNVDKGPINNSIKKH